MENTEACWNNALGFGNLFLVYYTENMLLWPSPHHRTEKNVILLITLHHALDNICKSH